MAWLKEKTESSISGVEMASIQPGSRNALRRLLELRSTRSRSLGPKRIPVRVTYVRHGMNYLLSSDTSTLSLRQRFSNTVSTRNRSYGR